MSAEIDHGWFDKLNGDDRDEALRQMLGVIPDVALGPRGPAEEIGPPLNG